MQTHRETYPEQYTHPLVGTRVVVRTAGLPHSPSPPRGVVTRVVPSRFGPLAELDGLNQTFYRVGDCTPEPSAAARRRTAVTVETGDYGRRTGHAPRGRGSWAFCTVDPSRADYLDHLIGTYADTYAAARRRARDDARARGFDTLWLCA